MMTLPLNISLAAEAQPEDGPKLGTVELRLPVLPVGEDLEQKKAEIAVRLSTLAIATRIRDAPGCAGAGETAHPNPAGVRSCGEAAARPPRLQ